MSDQLVLFEEEATSKEAEKASFNDPAFGSNKSLPIHRWVPWIAGFSSDFVSDALSTYLDESGTVLDPFAGVGTTLVEAMQAGHRAVGFEINPYAALVCRVKAKAHALHADVLQDRLGSLSSFYEERLSSAYEPVSEPPKGFRTRSEFYSPKVLRKVLIIQDFIDSLEGDDTKDVFRLTFAASMIRFSNYTYEPSLGTRKGAGKENIEDFPVLDEVAGKLSEIIADVREIRAQDQQDTEARARVIADSFFNCEQHMKAESVDLLITSPPYLNNYHYIRNTRPHLYWLGFVDRPKDTKQMEHANFGKYWQTVRSEERMELNFSLPESDLEGRLEHLRTLNPEKGVYGGNGWANYAASYFNDCYRFAEGMRYVLKPGSTALIVVGNSVLQGVNMPIDEYLSEIAAAVGLDAVGIHIPREKRVGTSIIQSDVRVAKAKNGRELYEAVVELRKPVA